MRVLYSFEMTGKCPVDQLPDRYGMTVISSRPIPCEEILAVKVDLESKTMFQEDMTAEMARRLKAEVRSVGWHSGIKLEVVAS